MALIWWLSEGGLSAGTLSSEGSLTGAAGGENFDSVAQGTDVEGISLAPALSPPYCGTSSNREFERGTGTTWKWIKDLKINRLSQSLESEGENIIFYDKK